MSGSRLGRGRGGRLAVYGGCGVVALLLVFLYRAATSEMARLRDLHVQCAHQQEALAAQLQVIFEYKVRLEKSLAEEKSSNAAVKQELQQRATREKSLRDKDSIEALQRFNSLQQTYKLLQTEHQDLQEECDKRQKQALEDTKRLEATLQDLRSRLRIAAEEKESFKHLKNKYLELDTENTRLQDKYNELLKTNGNRDSVIDHLKKEVIQLQRELETAKKSMNKATSPGPSVPIPHPSQQDQPQHAKEDPQNRPNPAGKAPPPQQPQSTASTSSMKAVPGFKMESSTTGGIGNPASVSPGKISAASKSSSKARLPPGVVPIPILLNDKLENREDKQFEDMKRKDEAAQNFSKNNPGSKENEDLLENVNLEQSFQGLNHNRRPEEPAAGRRANSGRMFRVEPGVQEIGEALIQMGRLSGLDGAADQQPGAADNQYDVDDDKEQQKNSDVQPGAEDEREDEEDQMD